LLGQPYRRAFRHVLRSTFSISRVLTKFDRPPDEGCRVYGRDKACKAFIGSEHRPLCVIAEESHLRLCAPAQPFNSILYGTDQDNTVQVLCAGVLGEWRLLRLDPGTKHKHSEPLRTCRFSLPGNREIQHQSCSCESSQWGAQPTRIWKFFMQKLCNKSDKCWYVHPPAVVPPQRAHPDTISLGQKNESSHQVPSNSRTRVQCKVLSRPRSRQNSSFPYLHA